MEAIYDGVRRTLHDDDKESGTYLYDTAVTGVRHGHGRD